MDNHKTLLEQLMDKLNELLEIWEQLDYDELEVINEKITIPISCLKDCRDKDVAFAKPPKYDD